MRAFGAVGPRDGRLWTARPVRGNNAGKDYRCPGCDHLIAAGTPHVVAWPEPDVDERRHWHTPCWRRAGGADAVPRRLGFHRDRGEG